MISFAITGSFASGKSFVMDIVKSIGYETFSCDSYIRELYENYDIQQKVLKAIPDIKIFDKKLIANIVFENDNYRKKLENLIFPLVLEAIEEFKEKNAGEEYLFFEVPLLFEAGYEKYFDHSICVFCSEAMREKRAKNVAKFSGKIYEKLKKIQLPQEEKILLSDFSINSENNRENIKELIFDILIQVKNKL